MQDFDRIRASRSSSSDEEESRLRALEHDEEAYALALALSGFTGVDASENYRRAVAADLEHGDRGQTPSRIPRAREHWRFSSRRLERQGYI